jgi:hypothetical protein
VKPGPSARQVAELERCVEVLRAHAAVTSADGFIPHRPHPKQAEFLSLDCLEALYGGAAGGGKSDALLMAALAYVHVPGYAALLLRRTFRDLNQPDAIMARSHEWLRRTDAKWHDRDKRWTFPSGATLTFGYLDSEADMYQYQGAALQFIGWDELTQFPERPYRYLFSRLRRLDGTTVPLRVRAATNPGGIGHEWVRRLFIDPGDPSRPFVPASLDDNPSIDAVSYRESLARLDSVTRAQLEKGVWVRDAAGLVYHFDEGRNVVPLAMAKKMPITHRVLALDFGVTAPTSFNILGWCEGDQTVYVLRSWKVANLAPSQAAETVRELEREHEFDAIVGDLGGLGKGFAAEAQLRFHLPMEAADKNNKHGYIALLNGDLEHGRLKVVRETCEPLIKEWAELPWNERRTGETSGFDNHCADGVLYGWRRCQAFFEEAPLQPRTREQIVASYEREIEEAADEDARKHAAGEWWENI